MDDPRFSNIKSDPKFRRVPKSQNKVKIDKRFKSMFTEKKFQIKYTVDKRGRPVNHHSKEDLKRYYEIKSDDENDDDKNLSETKKKTNKKHESKKSEVKNKKKSNEKNELNVKRKGDKSLPEDVKEKLFNLNIDYARGEENLYAESSSDDEETDIEVSESEEIDHKWGELDIDAEKTQQSTARIAACNLDWDRIRAVDLMVLLNSFLPPTGIIKSVAIYPSEFGKQRMKEEESKGPSELVKTEIKDDDQEMNEEEEKEEGATFHMEKLRQYQLNRLKYYYAVVTFDSAATADKVYNECDGMEYESSATKMDLRFIPDEMTFDDDPPKEICNSLPEKYEPRFFCTTALQQAKVNLTWDETDVNRLEFTEKLNSGKITDISEQDLQNYLAGSDSEEEDGTEKIKETENDKKKESESDEDDDNENDTQPKNTLDKYKALLQDIEQKEEEKKKKDGQMEISWEVDLKDKTDKIVKGLHGDKTPFQKYLDKRKEKRKAKREAGHDNNVKNADDIPSDIDMNDPYFAEEFNNDEFRKKTNKKKSKNISSNNNDEDNKQKSAELDLLLMNNEETNMKHFNLKKIQDQENESATKKKKRKKKLQDEKKQDEDDFQVDVKDERFAALFNSHLYNIDPSDSNYKKTKNMEKFVEEKLKRRQAEDFHNENVKKLKVANQNEPKKNTELNVLMKTVKRKAEAYKCK